MNTFKKILTISVIALFMTGCSSNKDLTGYNIDTNTEERTPITGFSDKDMVKSEGMVDLNGAAPGTQQDLVVNIGDRVFFGYDQHDLRGEALGTVEKQARWLKQYPNLNILIEGHCDERGTREYNLALGDKRAMSVRNYLVALGVSSSRINTISYGKERPTALGSNSSSWSQNRRGVVVIK